MIDYSKHPYLKNLRPASAPSTTASWRPGPFSSANKRLVRRHWAAASGRIAGSCPMSTPPPRCRYRTGRRAAAPWRTG